MGFDPWLSFTTAAQVSAAGHAGAAALDALQSARLERLLRNAAQNSPLFRRVLAGRPLHAGSLATLPVMRKPDLMARFDDWVSDDRLKLQALGRFIADPANIGKPYLGRYTVWESSGSSGEPGIFVQDASAMAVYDALEALRRPSLCPQHRWMDPYWLNECIAFVGATNGHFASTVSMERLRQLNPFLAPRLHSLSFLQPLPQLVAQLNALAPTVLTTYPSAAVLLGREQEAGRLRIPVREIWTGGEEFSEAMRRCVKQAFGCEVTNSYGASEFLALAFECPHGSLHLNSDWAILEPVDEQGRPVPAGEAGATTLLTNLANEVQPLIRYDLGDRVRIRTQRCSCGTALPAIDVQGRSDDTLLLGRRRGSPVEVLPLALCTVLECDAELFDFQLIQQDPTHLLLCTSMQGEAADAALQRGRDALAAYLRRLGVDGVRIRCRHAESTPGPRSCKSRRVMAASPLHPKGATGSPPVT